MSAQDTSSTSSPLALPAPSDVLKETENVTVNGTQTFKFDKLGPVVVNKDGVRFLRYSFYTFTELTSEIAQTLSRIANWEEMTPIKKDRTLRILVARNQYAFLAL